MRRLHKFMKRVFSGTCIIRCSWRKQRLGQRKRKSWLMSVKRWRKLKQRWSCIRIRWSTWRRNPGLNNPNTSMAMATIITHHRFQLLKQVFLHIIIIIQSMAIRSINNGRPNHGTSSKMEEILFFLSFFFLFKLKLVISLMIIAINVRKANMRKS